MKKELTLVAALAAVTTSLSAQTVVTLTADRDAALYEDPTGQTANGAGTGLFVGITGQPKIRRTLLHFDLSSIPAGSRILSATITTNTTLSSTTTPLDTTWHRALADWTEGASVAPGNGGGGTAALAGDATWLHRSYPSVLWTNVGGDFDPNPSFTMPIQGAGLSGSGFQQGLIDDLQTWLDNPPSNFGWLIKSDETLGPGTSKRFESRESSNGGVTLDVAYLTPGQVGEYGIGCTVNNQTMALGLTGPASSGTTVNLDYVLAPASSIGATFYALAIDYGPAGLGTPVFPPSCNVYLPANAIVPGNLWTTNATGQASDTFAVPPNAPGFLVVCQGAALAATPVGFTLSNAGVMLTN
jgi:hypothetical protein